MSARSRAWPWWGKRKERGLFCCLAPLEPDMQAIVSDPGTFQVHSEAQQWLNAEISKVIMGSELTEEVAPGSYDRARIHEDFWAGRREQFRSAFVAHFIKRQALEQWQKLMMLYGMPKRWQRRERKIIEHPPFGQGQHAGPKWGQRGRKRKRKARLLARSIYAQAQRRAGKEWNR